MKESIENKIVLVKQGKKGFIAYDPVGKIILPSRESNINKEGWVRIQNVVVEKPNYYIANMVPEYAYDYYNGIHIDELKDVLRSFWFKIGFELPFKHEIDGQEMDELAVFAYHMKTGTTCWIETFTFPDEKPYCDYNSVRISRPGVNGHHIVGHNYLAESGSGDHCNFDLYRYKNNNGAMHPMHFIMSLPSESNIWKRDTPCLFTYEERHMSNNVWSDALDRILLCDPEIEELFIGNERMEAIFAKRK